jgi:hypothetical protein
MRTIATSLCVLVLLVTSAAAQTPGPAAPTQFQLLILPPTGDPLTLVPVATQTTAIGATQNCGIDPSNITPPPANPINPLLFAMDDPFTPNKKCRLSFPTVLPAGQYQWAGVMIAPSCVPVPGGPTVSPCASARGVGTPPFSIVNPVLPPGAPTALQLTQ